MTTSEPITEQIEKVDAVEVVPSAPIKFDVTKAAIEQMIGHAAGLSIAGPQDKAGFDAVYDYRQVVRRQRLAVDKRATELKAPHSQYIKDVDAVADQLIDGMKQIEKKLSIQEKAYKDERERLAQEQRMFLQNRTEGRVKNLRTLGFEWNDQDETYDFIREEYSLHLRINFDDIKGLTDEDFEPTAFRAQAIFDSEQKYLGEKKERERINAEKLATQQREEKERQNKIAQQQKEEAARIQKDKDDLAKQVLDSRIERLEGLGFESTWEGVFVLGYKAFNHNELGALSAYAFKEEITAFIAWKADQDEKQQQAIERGKLLDARKAELVPLGFNDLIEGGMEDPYEFILSNGQILDYTDEEFVAYKESVITFAEKQKQAEIDKLAADQERKNRLAPEKKRLVDHFNKVGKWTDLKLVEPETLKLKLHFDDFLAQSISQYIALAETL